MFMRVILPLLQSQVPDLERSLPNAQRDGAAACLPLGLSARSAADCSHHWRLGDAGASIFLSTALVVLVMVGRSRILWSPPFYWTTIVMIRAAGTVIGDFFASRNMFGLPLSTLITGILFIGLLLLWKEPSNGRVPVASNP